MSLSPAQLTKDEAKHVLANVINYPLFVPELGRQVTQALISGEVMAFMAELERLSSLDSSAASALLAYLEMKGVCNRRSNLDRAQALCVRAARNGEPYSQYVMGWICRASGRDSEAIDWLRKAASKTFLPALVDIARFLAGGVGVEAPDSRAALAVLWDAHRLGHRMALVYIAELLRETGSGNWTRRTIGAGLYPIAIARAVRFTSRYPLSDQIFVTSNATKRPIFK